jgi:hypothetical protein
MKPPEEETHTADQAIATDILETFLGAEETFIADENHLIHPGHRGDVLDHT